MTLDIDTILTKHWLVIGADGRIAGCHCGYRADLTAYDYGDSVLRHFLEVADGWGDTR